MLGALASFAIAAGMQASVRADIVRSEHGPPMDKDWGTAPINAPDAEVGTLAAINGMHIDLYATIPDDTGVIDPGGHHTLALLGDEGSKGGHIDGVIKHKGDGLTALA